MAWLPYHHDWRLAYQFDVGLRVHWFGRYAGYPEWAVPASRLAIDMVNFFFVEKSACWVIINGRKLLLQTGDLLVVSGADEFAYGHDPVQPHVSTSACLAVQQGSVANTLLQRKFDRRYHWNNPAEYAAEFDKVLSAMASSLPYRDLEIAGTLLHWLAYVMAHLRAPLDHSFPPERRMVDRILTAEAWAIERLKHPITLAEWSRALGMNPVYFGRLFKKETGLRPMEWLNQRRLQMASQHLSSTSKSVAEIAQECGFADQFYFSRVFRHHFNQSPLQYRKERF
ncbi:MAG: AraC family transcriptional regulator [Verrucomicrobiota bacterium]|jgi:AraC-like DNA-binding protein